MSRVLVSEPALQLLVAAGKSVLTSSTNARREGRGGVGVDYEQALRNAISLAESALNAHQEPQEAMSPTPISQGDVVQYAQRQYIVAEVQADLLVLDVMADGDPATCRERCTVLAEDVQIVGTQFRMEDVDAKR